MSGYIVEMFGLPYSLTGKRRVEFELENSAGLTDIVGALKREVPELIGEILNPDSDYLMDGFTFNINGRFYSDDRDLKIKEGDRIILLTLATIG